jgi:replication-associated recombination protein RarA
MFKNFDKKYTPKTLNDIVFQTAKTRKMAECLTNGVFGFPMSGINGIVLYGVYGSGKSALAKIMPQLIEEANGGDGALVSYFNIAQGGDNGASVIESIKRQAELIPLDNKFHYFVLDEVDNLNQQAMAVLKSVMNTPQCVFVMTTNHYSQIEAGVCSRSHCIPFMAAPDTKWLPLARRMVTDAGLMGMSDQHLLNVIATGKGSAREILDSVISVILHAQELKADSVINEL